MHLPSSPRPVLVCFPCTAHQLEPSPLGIFGMADRSTSNPPWRGHHETKQTTKLNQPKKENEGLITSICCLAKTWKSRKF